MRAVPMFQCFLAAILALPALANGQANRSADVWVSGGVGGGWARVSCAICQGDRELGATGYGRIGTTLRDGILLGAEANGWTRDLEEGGREWVGGIGAVGYLYPKPAGSLFVKVGLGYLTYRADNDDDDRFSTGSVGVQLGAGYEFRVGTSLLITNYMNLLASSFSKLREGETEVVGDVSVTLLQIGVGLTRR